MPTFTDEQRKKFRAGTARVVAKAGLVREIETRDAGKLSNADLAAALRRIAPTLKNAQNGAIPDYLIEAAQRLEAKATRA